MLNFLDRNRSVVAACGSPPLTLSSKLERVAKTAPNTYLVPTYGPRSQAELTPKAWDFSNNGVLDAPRHANPAGTLYIGVTTTPSLLALAAAERTGL